MIFRLSQKLAKKIKTGPLETVPLDEIPYADWSAHLFTADRTQYIILSNTMSLYSCVMLGKGITSDSKFIERALSTIREFMQDDGQQFPYRKFIAPSSGFVQFAKALDRRVTGSMNELIFSAELMLVEEEMAPHDVGFRLNDLLFSALATEVSYGYDTPNNAFKRLAVQADSSGNDEDTT